MLSQTMSLNVAKFGAWSGASLLIGMIALFGSQVVWGNDADIKAAMNSSEYLTDFCFDGAAEVLSWREIRDLYLEKTNDLFNANVKSIMSSELAKDAAPVISFENFAQNPLSSLCVADDQVCQTIVLCKDNNSTYCTAVNTTGFSKNHYTRFQDKDLLKAQFPYLRNSYLCLYSTLKQKQDEVNSESGEQILVNLCSTKGKAFWSGRLEDLKKKVGENVKEKRQLQTKVTKVEGSLKMCDKFESWQQENNPGVKAQLKAEINVWIWNNSKLPVDDSGNAVDLKQLAKRTGDDSEAMAKELAKSKAALDSTLELYDELQGAWMLHVKYVDIYDQLVKMRDGLKSVRARTDWFPNRFVNATTSRCL